MIVLNFLGTASDLMGLVTVLNQHIKDAHKRNEALGRVEYYASQIFKTEARLILKVISREHIANLLVSGSNKREHLIGYIRDEFQESQGLTWSPYTETQVNNLVDEINKILLANDIQPIQAAVEVIVSNDDKNHEKTRAVIKEEVSKLLPKTHQKPSIDSAGNVSNLPIETQYFTGREQILEQMGTSLTEDLKVISGLGGVGKTQLALHYAKQHQDNYKIRWFIRSETLATTQLDLGRLAIALNLADETMADRAKIDKLTQHLANRSDWLLVFDNADDFDALTEALSYLGEIKGKVIVTTRISDWQNLVTPIYVGVWQDSEARDFLLNRLNDKTLALDDVSALYQLLGNLPLGLEQAAAYINAVRITVFKYIELFTVTRDKLWRDRTHERSPADYKQTVSTTWQISIEKTEEDFPGSRELLQVCSLFSPDYIPIPLLILGKDILPGNLPVFLSDELTVLGVLAALEKYSLVERNRDSQDFLSMHRLVQHVVRDSITEITKWLEAVVALLLNTFPLKAGFPETYELSDLYATHMMSSSALLLQYGGDPLLATEAMCEAAAALFVRGKMGGTAQPFKVAELTLEYALTIREELFGNDHESLVKVLGSLADAKRRYARQLNEDSARVSEHVKEDFRSLGAIEPVVFLLLERDRANQEATTLYERACQISQQQYGKESLDYALRLGRLAMACKDKATYFGDDLAMRKSVSLQEEAIEVVEKLISEEWVPAHELESYLHNFGLTLVLDRQGERALQVLGRGLTLAKTKYPEKSPDIAIFYDGIGLALAAEERFTEAAENFVKAARIYRANKMVQDHRNNSFCAMYCYRELGFPELIQLYDLGFDTEELVDRSATFESVILGYNSEISRMTREVQAAVKEICFDKLKEKQDV